jgi:hypothetical protein
MTAQITSTSTTTTLKNNGNTYLSVDTNDVVALTNPLPVASGGTGSALGAASGSIAQVAFAKLTTSATSTALIPADDTIPQNTEGAEILTLAITPKSATSTLIISVDTNLRENSNSAGGAVLCALFRDSTADAIAANIGTGRAAAAAYAGMEGALLQMSTSVSAASTSETTFKLRVGGEQAGTYRWNGGNGSRKLGGVMTTSITIYEVLA